MWIGKRKFLEDESWIEMRLGWNSRRGFLDNPSGNQRWGSKSSFSKYGKRGWCLVLHLLVWRNFLPLAYQRKPVKIKSTNGICRREDVGVHPELGSLQQTENLVQQNWITWLNFPYTFSLHAFSLLLTGERRVNWTRQAISKDGKIAIINSCLNWLGGIGPRPSFSFTQSRIWLCNKQSKGQANLLFSVPDLIFLSEDRRFLNTFLRLNFIGMWKCREETGKDVIILLCFLWLFPCLAINLIHIGVPHSPNFGTEELEHRAVECVC